MRQTLALALLLLSPLPSQAQALRELPETEPVPATVSASVGASLYPDENLEGLRRWEGNLVGDATPDLLVEAVLSPVGGNAIYARHWIFIGGPGGYGSFFPIELPGTLLTAGIERNALVVTVPRLLPGEPRCCPTGVEAYRLPLN